MTNKAYILKRPKILLSTVVALGLISAPSAYAQNPAQDRQAARGHVSNQEWQQAIDILTPLANGDQAIPLDWYALGLARQGAGDPQNAIAAYAEAEKRGFPNVAILHFQRARSLMALNLSAEAFSELEKLGELGGVNFRAVQSAAEFASISSDPKFVQVIDKLKPCRADYHRQFDFWLGKWSVVPASNPNQRFQSEISLIQDSCAIMENYKAGNLTGTSINFYDTNTGKWHQSWMSNNAGAVHLQGGLNEEGAMVLSDIDLEVSKATGNINRVTWSPNEDGSVRQHWQVSQDGGETWTTAFDGNYVPRGE